MPASYLQATKSLGKAFQSSNAPIPQAQKAEEARSQAESRLQEELEKTKSLQQRLTGTADLQQHCSGLKAEREHLKASLASLQVLFLRGD